MSNTDRNDNLQLVRKQQQVDNQTKGKEPAAAKSLKSSQTAIKEGQPKAGADAARGSGVMKIKAASSIEPVRTMS